MIFLRVSREITVEDSEKKSMIARIGVEVFDLIIHPNNNYSFGYVLCNKCSQTVPVLEFTNHKCT